MVAGILGYRFGATYAAATVGTIAAYTAFTFGITQWRTKFRQQMNAADNQAATRAVDSLINYEGVKVRIFFALLALADRLCCTVFQ